MNPRKVVVMIEMDSDESIRELRDKEFWREVFRCYRGSRRGSIPKIHQVQANVVKVEKGGKQAP